MTDDTVQVIDQLVAAWNTRSSERVAALYTEDCYGMDVAIAIPQIGRQGIQRMFEAYWHAFPDLEISQDDTVVDGDRVALFWTARGTHLARSWPFQPPAGALPRRVSTVWCCKTARYARR